MRESVAAEDLPQFGVEFTLDQHARDEAQHLPLISGADRMTAPDLLFGALPAGPHAPLAARRGQPLPLPADVFKLSPHGSRANTATALLRTVRAQHHVVSTNGAMFGHPDREAIARTVREGPGGVRLEARGGRWRATAAA